MDRISKENFAIKRTGKSSQARVRPSRIKKSQMIPKPPMVILSQEAKQERMEKALRGEEINEFSYLRSMEAT